MTTHSGYWYPWKRDGYQTDLHKLTIGWLLNSQFSNITKEIAILHNWELKGENKTFNKEIIKFKSLGLF